jgi:hypothetical protein
MGNTLLRELLIVREMVAPCNGEMRNVSTLSDVSDANVTWSYMK